jgi:hypothetical protein
VAFVRRLVRVPGITPDVLRNAYLHRQWAPFRSALRAQLGGDAAVNQFLNLLKKVGADGENPDMLRRARTEQRRARSTCRSTVVEKNFTLPWFRDIGFANPSSS